MVSIYFPLEAEENDILGRELGEPLWPERYGNTFINEERRNVEVKEKKVQEEKKPQKKRKLNK
ncbi:hypothetical protein ABIE66_001905 [Peribacillus sp. B2I2]|uniref:hypothetical protein n=1 Tax=Peribacillus sp. B2I2 TaxID=3156468 RepID=UPI0035114DF6